jgi:hypothetical protein
LTSATFTRNKNKVTSTAAITIGENSMADRLSFRLVSIVERREITTLINGRRYIHLIDGACCDKFERLYKYSPGKALAYLKRISKDYWRANECTLNGLDG